jgi:hypothetical protein
MLLGQRRRWMNGASRDVGVSCPASTAPHQPSSVCVCLTGTVAAYSYWLFKEGDLEFAMSGLKNARMLQVGTPVE